MALNRKLITKLRSVICHMGSHSVSCHPTQDNVPRLNPAKQAGTGTPKGWKAELTLMLVIYLDGSPIRRQSAIQVVTT